MEKFTTLKGIAAQIPDDNISTDRLLPAEALQTLRRAGLGKFLFAGERLSPDGREDPSFILNQAAWRKAAMLITGENFGTGDVQDHLYWALVDFGIRVVIAPSFAPDFDAGSHKHGVLTITLPAEQITLLQQAATDKVLLTVDLDRQTISTENRQQFNFKVDDFKRYCLLGGLDDIGLTLEHEDAIAHFEKQHRQDYPWLQS